MKSEQIISWELFFTKLQDFIQYQPAFFLSSIQFSSVQSLNRVQLFVTPCISSIDVHLSIT